MHRRPVQIMKPRKLRARRRSLGQISGGLALLEAINNGKIHLAKFILAATTNLDNNETAAQFMSQTGGKVNPPSFGNKLTVGAGVLGTTGPGGPAGPTAGRNKLAADYKRIFGSFSDGNRTSSIVDTRDFQYKTPLIRAVFIKDDKIRKKAVELLIKFGAHVNAQDSYGRTALSYACQFQKNDVIKILVKHNVNPDLSDNKGNTPLMYAIKANNVSGVHILLRCFKKMGVLNFDHKNIEGITALDIAVKNNNKECIDLVTTLSGRPYKLSAAMGQVYGINRPTSAHAAQKTPSSTNASSNSAIVSDFMRPMITKMSSLELKSLGAVGNKIKHQSTGLSFNKDSGPQPNTTSAAGLANNHVSTLTLSSSTKQDAGVKDRNRQSGGPGTKKSPPSSETESSSDFSMTGVEEDLMSISELLLLKGAETQGTVDYNTRSDIKAMLMLKRSLSLPAIINKHPQSSNNSMFLNTVFSSPRDQIGIGVKMRTRPDFQGSKTDNAAYFINPSNQRNFSGTIGLTPQQHVLTAPRRTSGASTFKSYVRKSLKKLRQLERDKSGTPSSAIDKPQPKNICQSSNDGMKDKNNVPSSSNIEGKNSDLSSNIPLPTRSISPKRHQLQKSNTIYAIHDGEDDLIDLTKIKNQPNKISTMPYTNTTPQPNSTEKPQNIVTKEILPKTGVTVGPTTNQSTLNSSTSSIPANFGGQITTTITVRPKKRVKE